MDDEDDYLSDKFLQRLEAKEKSNKSYSQRRNEAQRESETRNLAGRIKSKKELEKEAMDKLKEGMSTSLFEREKLAVAEGGTESKAMRMMSKMGFKPGQALGRQEASVSSSDPAGGSKAATNSKKTVPISINLWEGRKGLGAMKRPLSPDSVTHELERAAKTAKTQTTMSQEDFRSRNRAEYEEKRDEGRLLSAQKTCALLDERAGIAFNHLTVNPRRAALIPPKLLDALGIEADTEADDTYQSNSRRLRKDNMERLNDDETHLDSGLARRLREEIKRDALVSRHNTEYDDADEPLSMGSAARKSGVQSGPEELQVTPALVEQTKEFLQQSAKVRLERVLSYMREEYFFCFWCGTEYKSRKDMDTSCPGDTEEMHD